MSAQTLQLSRPLSQSAELSRAERVAEAAARLRSVVPQDFNWSFDHRVDIKTLPLKQRIAYWLLHRQAGSPSDKIPIQRTTFRYFADGIRECGDDPEAFLYLTPHNSPLGKGYDQKIGLIFPARDRARAEFEAEVFAVLEAERDARIEGEYFKRLEAINQRLESRSAGKGTDL